MLDPTFCVPEILRTATRSRVRLDGVELAVLDFGGEGPLALLHHANGFCAGVWGVVAERLRSRFHVIAFDARGHGDSSKPEAADAFGWAAFAGDLAALAERLLAIHGGDRIGLGLGHSFGGTNTLLAASRHPGLYERIALVDPVIVPPPDAPVLPERAERVALLANAARERQAVRGSRAEAIAGWRERRFFADWDPRVLALYAADGLRDRADGGVELKCPGYVEAAVFEAGEAVDLAGAAERVTCPALLLWARRGDFPRAVFEALTARLPDGRLEDLDTGHLAVMEQPDRVADAVLRFVDGR